MSNSFGSLFTAMLPVSPISCPSVRLIFSHSLSVCLPVPHLPFTASAEGDGRMKTVSIDLDANSERGTIAKIFKASDYNVKLQEATSKIYEGYMNTEGTNVRFIDYPTSFLTQV